jgi:hypothetical protein
MGQRDDRHQHANRRRKLEQDTARKRSALEARVPLAGYEELYEISRSGRLFSRSTRAVLVGGYHHSPVIRIAVDGAIVTLAKGKAVKDSFARIADMEPSDATKRN